MLRAKPSAAPASPPDSSAAPSRPATASTNTFTTGMAPGRGGDSGAPVWILRDDGHAHLHRSISLGGRTARAGGDYGRFSALATAIDTLGLSSTTSANPVEQPAQYDNPR